MYLQSSTSCDPKSESYIGSPAQRPSRKSNSCCCIADMEHWPCSSLEIMLQSLVIVSLNSILQKLAWYPFLVVAKSARAINFSGLEALRLHGSTFPSSHEAWCYVASSNRFSIAYRTFSVSFPVMPSPFGAMQSSLQGSNPLGCSQG